MPDEPQATGNRSFPFIRPTSFATVSISRTISVTSSTWRAAGRGRRRFGRFGFGTSTDSATFAGPVVPAFLTIVVAFSRDLGFGIHSDTHLVRDLVLDGGGVATGAPAGAAPGAATGATAGATGRAADRGTAPVGGPNAAFPSPASDSTGFGSVRMSTSRGGIGSRHSLSRPGAASNRGMSAFTSRRLRRLLRARSWSG
jgi:hypothetical protein